MSSGLPCVTMGTYVVVKRYEVEADSPEDAVQVVDSSEATAEVVTAALVEEGQHADIWLNIMEEVE